MLLIYTCLSIGRMIDILVRFSSLPIPRVVINIDKNHSVILLFSCSIDDDRALEMIRMTSHQGARHGRGGPLSQVGAQYIIVQHCHALGRIYVLVCANKTHRTHKIMSGTTPLYLV